jgi:serine/threonine protein kinase
MDPIYLQSGLLTKKSDVYSFGVVLLELLSRKKAAFGEDRTLVKAFLDGYKEDKQVLELFDKEILVEKDIGVLHQLAMLILECLELNVDRRPEMTDVAERLHNLKRSHKIMNDENNSATTT